MGPKSHLDTDYYRNLKLSQLCVFFLTKSLAIFKDHIVFYASRLSAFSRDHQANSRASWLYSLQLPAAVSRHGRRSAVAAVAIKRAGVLTVAHGSLPVLFGLLHYSRRIQGVLRDARSALRTVSYLHIGVLGRRLIHVHIAVAIVDFTIARS